MRYISIALLMGFSVVNFQSNVGATTKEAGRTRIAELSDNSQVFHLQKFSEVLSRLGLKEPAIMIVENKEGEYKVFNAVEWRTVRQKMINGDLIQVIFQAIAAN